MREKKNIKFAVGQGRMGPRVPSHSKNINRLTKLTPARPANNVTQSPNHNADEAVKRNLSSGQLARDQSNVNLRKNQSETSLKNNNRSTGQLNKLARPGSSRNMAKHHRHANRPKRTNSGPKKSHAQDEVAQAVRFDLSTSHDDRDEPEMSGEEEEEGAWENYTDSRSPSITRASTPRASSTITSPRKPARVRAEVNGEPPDKKPEPSKEDPQVPTPQASTPVERSISSMHEDSKQAQNHRATTPHADNVASRLLKRNTSFINAALPQISANSATPTLIGNSSHATSSTANSGGSSTEVVSRFLNQPSTSTTPQKSTFLPSSSDSPGKDWRRLQEPADEEFFRRNKSFSDVPAMRVSRTQQKLNLERESAVAQDARDAKHPPPSVLRATRMSNANVPFYEVGDGTADGRLHPQLRHLFEQTATEYKRIRMYQHPLTDAIKRLEEVGAVPPRSINSRNRPGNRKGGLFGGSGDGAYGLSQSWRSHRSSKSGDAKEKTSTTPSKDLQMNGAARRSRVMFQGMNGGADAMSDGRPSIDGQQDIDEKDAGQEPQRENARELCRRLWDRREAGGSDD